MLLIAAVLQLQALGFSFSFFFPTLTILTLFPHCVRESLGSQTTGILLRNGFYVVDQYKAAQNCEGKKNQKMGFHFFMGKKSEMCGCH